MTKPDDTKAKSELRACVLYTVYDEFGKEVKLTLWSDTLGNAYSDIVDFTNKFKMSLDKPKPVSRNPDEEERIPLDEEGNELVKDQGNHLPGDTGFWHVRRIELSKSHEGKSKMVLTGVYGQDEKTAEFPFLQNNLPLNMLKGILEIIKPEAKEDEYYNAPHDEDVNWKVSYRFSNKLNSKGYYFKNITSIEPWS